MNNLFLIFHLKQITRVFSGTFLQKFKNIFSRRTSLALLAALLLSSCTDNGCIDADDFGEYESETIEVPANSAQGNCTYNHALDLLDSAQGSGIANCLISGDTTITDETGSSRTSNAGCSGFSAIKFKNLCINECVQLCNSSGLSSSSAEPNWVSTKHKISGKNIGVTIRPGSKVMVRAIGNVTLGEAGEYPDIFVQAKNPTPHARNKGWTSDVFHDVRRNQSLFVKFSGFWKDGADAAGAADKTVGAGQNSLGGSNGLHDSEIINGARRLVAYISPHPDNYDFNTSKTTEKAGSRGVPLLPDPVAWKCRYSSTGDLLESTCDNSSTGYTDAGYTGVDNVLANAEFPISSDSKSHTLGKYGGMIRWKNDGITSAADPFVAESVTCDNDGVCSNIDKVTSANAGFMVGSLHSADVVVPNNGSYPLQISLKSLSSDDACKIRIGEIAILDSTSLVLTSFTNVDISDTAWTTNNITLEPTHKLKISANTDANSGGINCGLFIAVKTTKYHDIKIQRSGFVKFTTLGTPATTTTLGVTTSKKCILQGRIVNPAGSHKDLYTSSYTADFYEYDALLDPFKSVSVPYSPPLGALTFTDPEIFLRKGQVIRFSPESWDGTWINTAGGERQCGIGMAMVINPRPALLCRGKATDIIDNPACTSDYSSAGALTGCKSTVLDCSDVTHSDYCPSVCQKIITCTAGVESNNYTKTACSPTDPPPPVTTATATTSIDCTTYTGCANCATRSLAQAALPAKIGIDNLDQCYDLENYQGKVSNIPEGSSLTRVDLDLFLSGTKAKGLTRLTASSSKYKNFDSFTVVPASDPLFKHSAAFGNTIYSLKAPIIAAESGRLKFFVLDGDDFNKTSGTDHYDNNSDPLTGYKGNNGFMINTTGTLEYSNGKWLQVRLCQETDSTTSICKEGDPLKLAGQPYIIDIAAPVANAPTGTPPNITTPYKFNSYGNLNKASSVAQTADCTVATHDIDSGAGATFYCHTYKYFSETALSQKTDTEVSDINSEIARLRLSFKILDPEEGSCHLTDASTFNDGLKVNNPFYDSTIPAGSTTPVGAGSLCDSKETPGLLSSSTTAKPTCQDEFYCANKYYNNSGKYYVNIKVKSTDNSAVSDFIGYVIKPIIEVMDGKQDDPSTADDESTIGQAERVYSLLIADSRYQAILSIALVTMFTFYGFGYLIGVVEMSHADLINRVIKISLIYLFVGETGWYWFDKIVVSFFKEGTDYLAFMMASSFDSSSELSKAIGSGDYYDKSVLFSTIDKVFNLFFSSAVQKKISALLFASIFGWAYLFIIYAGFVLYMLAVANAVLLYLTAQVFISVLFVLGPIFFVFTLFSQTKDMFDNWLKQLISFSLQQIFLLTTLAFFNMLMYEVIKMSLGYKICWDEVWTINIITRITLLSFWTVSSLPPRTNAHSEVGNIGNPEGIPSLFTILFIWIIASLMNKFIGFMTDLASTISGGLSASALGKGVADTVKGLKKGAIDIAKKGADKLGLHPVRTLDKFLFDSGKLAEESRTAKRKQNSKDSRNKKSMAKAGDKAVSDYKKENATKLSGESQAEQRKLLNAAREKGMTTEGQRLGLSSAEAKKLQNDTGLKYTGSNILAASAQLIKQKATKGGSLSTSLNDRKLKDSFSSKEAQGALKNMKNPAERAAFVQSAKKGNINVREGARISNIRKSAAVLGASAGRAVGQGAFDAKRRIFGDRAETEARQQLVKEGVIADHSGGIVGSAFRRGDEKKLIKERRKENVEAQQASESSSKSSSNYAIAQLEASAKYADRVDAIKDSGDDSITSSVGKGFRQAGNYIAKSIGAGSSRTASKESNAVRDGHLKKGAIDQKVHIANARAALGAQAADLDQAMIDGKDDPDALKSAHQARNKLNVDNSNLDIRDGKIK